MPLVPYRQGPEDCPNQNLWGSTVSSTEMVPYSSICYSNSPILFSTLVKKRVCGRVGSTPSRGVTTDSGSQPNAPIRAIGMASQLDRPLHKEEK